MSDIFKKRFFTQFTKTQLYLMVGNFLLVFFLIFLSNLGILPLKNMSDFLFFTFLLLFFSLYRPGWAFLIFVGTIALENINLAPVSVGIAVRPYQFFGALIILAIVVRLIAKRLNFSLEKPRWYDFLVLLMVAGSFVSALGSTNSALSFKLSIIFLSFAVLYFLVRNYIRDIADLKKIIPFFLGSSLVIILYGIWQNISFVRGLIAYEVMPGRPNATFTEADWLGIFVVFLLAVIYAINFHLDRKIADNQSSQLFKSFLFLFLVSVYILLIITVSRSAWLGALVATLGFLFLIILANLRLIPESRQWKQFLVMVLNFAVIMIFSAGIVYFFKLTDFQLFSRAQSAGTGLQKITIACGSGTKVPERIESVAELEKFGCRHVNLEEIENEILAGNVVGEIYRDDPNVSIRKEIYKKSWQEIKKNPLLGIGWGSIGKILGTDERGASLNASNIFLEVWLGAGLLGFLAFLAFWIYILWRNISNFIKTKNSEEQAFTIFVVVSWFGLTVANLFNSGILLGFFWLFLAISLIELQPARPEKI